MKYLTKADYKSCHGYWVRMPAFDPKTGEKLNWKNQDTKWFSATVFGDMRKAEQAAKKYRDDYLEKNNASYLATSKICKSGPRENSARNSSGIIGVRLSEKESDSGEIYYGWSCFFQIKGKQRIKTFAVIKWGDHEAFDMACQRRYEESGVLIVTDKRAVPFEIKPPHKFVKLSAPSTSYYCITQKTFRFP